MEISLAPEIIWHFGALALTNSMLTAFLITCLMLAGALAVRLVLQKNPGRLQVAIELIYTWIDKTANEIIQHPKATRELLPFVLTLFVFIILSNWSGLLPGFGTIHVMGLHDGKVMPVPLFRAPTSDLNMTIALALLSVGYVQYLGMKYTGVITYIGRFLNVTSPIGLFIGIIELIGEVARIISFSFRLFGNIFAGEVLLSVMFFLTITLMPYMALIPLPFFVLELFVGLIQAFVFAFLTMLFVSLAVVSHDEEHTPHHSLVNT